MVYPVDPGAAAAEDRRHGDGGRCGRGAAGRPGGALMARGRVPVLWITGPAGVGKSTVSWQLFTELAGSGTRAAFADADQLCMCYPAPPDDPGRDLIRVRNVGVVIRNSRAAGARRVIVNGVVDPALGVRRDLLEQAEITVCRLGADQDEVVRRFTGRQRGGGGEAGDLVRQVRDDCDRMDASGFADVCVDTTGVSAAEAARLVRDRCRGWPGFGLVGEQPGAAPGGPGPPGWERGERQRRACPAALRPRRGRQVDDRLPVVPPLPAGRPHCRLTSTWTRSDSSRPAAMVIRATTGSRPAISRVSGGPATLPEPGTW